MTPQETNNIANLFNGGGEETNLLQYVHDIIESKFNSLPDSYLAYMNEYIHVSDLISAYFLARGIGVERSYRDAVIIWKKVHRHGFNVANYNLAVAYYYGLGVPADINEAKKYLSEVSHLDNSAKSFLANITNYQNIKPSFHIYSPDIVSGSTLEAEVLLIENRTTEAIELFKKNNDADSFSRLAALYAGVNKELFTLYYNKAKELNHPDTLRHIAENLSTDDIFKNPVSYYSDYDFEETILDCFRGEDNIWDIIYSFLGILRNANEIDDLNSEKEQWIQLLRRKININPNNGQDTFFDDLKRVYNKYPKQVITELCSYVWNTEIQGIYSSDVFLTSLHSLLETSREILFDGDIIPLKYLKYVDSNKKYTFIVTDEDTYILASFIIELIGITNVTLWYPWENKRGTTFTVSAETRVLFPDLRNTLCQGADTLSRMNQTFSLEDIFNQPNSRTIVLTNRDFCGSYNTQISGYRQQLCNRRIIEKIIELPKDTFKAVPTSTALLSLNFEKPSEDVCFIKNDKQIEVSYDTLQKHQYILSYDLYSQDIQAGNEQQIVRLSDIVDFRFTYDKRSEGNPVRCLSEDNFHPSLLGTIKHRNQYATEDTRMPVPILKEYKGPHIFLKFKDGVQLNIQTGDTYCFPDYGSCAIRLKPDSPVKSLEYLAYILLSEDINRYLCNITDKNGDFIIRELMYKKVAIHTNPDKQNEVVRKALAKERQKITEDLQYNIVVITDNAQIINEIDSNDGISVFAKDQSYEDIFKNHISDSSKRFIDAIVVDSDSPEFDNVIEDFNDIRERDIHVYVINNASELDISGRKKRAYFADGNRIFGFTTKDERNRLIEAIRNDLDSSKASQVRIRMKYKDVFDAAAELDKKYNLNICETIIQYIQNGCEIENAQNTAFDKLRDVCHKLLEIFAEKKVTPKLKPGAIASLLADGHYTNKDKNSSVTYVMVHNILDNTPGLSKALEFFCFIANKEVHGQQYSSKLGTSVLNILMEFILRFYQMDILDNKLELLGRDSIAYIEDSAFIGKTYSVQASDDGKYYYVATDVSNIGIHIQTKPELKLKPGDKIKIASSVKQEIKDKQVINGTNVILLLYAMDYQIVK